MVEQQPAEAEAGKKRKSKKGSKRKSSKGQENGLPGHLDLQRTHVICGPDVNYHVRAAPPTSVSCHSCGQRILCAKAIICPV